MKMNKAQEAFMLAQWFVTDILGQTWDKESKRCRFHLKIANQTLVGNSLEDVKEAIRLRQADALRRGQTIKNIFEAKWIDGETGLPYTEKVKHIPPPPSSPYAFVEWLNWIGQYGKRAQDEGKWDGKTPNGLEKFIEERDVQRQTRGTSIHSRPSISRESRKREGFRRPVPLTWTD